MHFQGMRTTPIQPKGNVMRHLRLASCCLFLLNLGTLFGIGAAFAAPFAYIPNQGSDDVSVIDTAANVVVAVVRVGSNPIGVAANSAGTIVYVANVGASTVSVIDTFSNTVLATVPVGSNPLGIAVNPAGTFVYVTNIDGGTVSVIDAASNAVVVTIPVGAHPAGVAFNPAGTFAYVANTIGTVSVIDAATNTVSAAIAVGSNPVGVAFNPAGTFAYVANGGDNSVSVIDTATRAVVATVPVGVSPIGVAFNPAGTFAYVANDVSDSVSVIDTATRTVVATVTVGTTPYGVAVNPAGTLVYVANVNSDNVSVIDAATNRVVATVATGGSPAALGNFVAWPPGTGALSSNHTALWWNPAESGWGINFDHQGNIIFATLFTYDLSGNPMWLVMSSGNLQADGKTYAGSLYRTTGPAFNAVPFTPLTAPNLTTVGTMSVIFPTSNTATLTYSVNGTTVTKAIQKQVYDVGVPICGSSATSSRATLTNYQDLWWNPNESGWGMNITHQGNILFATLFTYDATGKGLWLVMSAGMKQSDGTFLGDLYQTTGPAFNAQPFTPIGPANLTKVGTMWLSFSDGQTGTLTYSVNGQSVVKAITRQVFSSPTASCR